MSDREHFKVHVNRSEDQLFISKLVIGRAAASKIESAATGGALDLETSSAELAPDRTAART